jgi:hypothetical protein
MLPRLQFVVMAAFVAALPWIVFSSGLLPDFFSSSIAEYTHHLSPSAVAVTNLSDVRQMYMMSYVRRSRELDRLRELASAPLSDWVNAPAGEADLATPEIFRHPVPVTATQLAALPVEMSPAAADVVETKPSEPAPQVAAPDNGLQSAEPDMVSAAIAPQPEASAEPDTASASAPSHEAPAAPATPMPLQQAAVETATAAEAEPDLPKVVGFVPPLPRERPHIRVKRTHRSYTSLAQPAPLPPPSPIPSQIFSAPPAGPRDTNDAPQRYGRPL